MKQYIVIKKHKSCNFCDVVAQFDDYDKADTFAQLYNEQSENVRYWVYEQSK